MCIPLNLVLLYFLPNPHRPETLRFCLPGKPLAVVRSGALPIGLGSAVRVSFVQLYHPCELKLYFQIPSLYVSLPKSMSLSIFDLEAANAPTSPSKFLETVARDHACFFSSSPSLPIPPQYHFCLGASRSSTVRTSW